MGYKSQSLTAKSHSESAAFAESDEFSAHSASRSLKSAPKTVLDFAELVVLLLRVGE
jgi:hypothetical protein